MTKRILGVIFILIGIMGLFLFLILHSPPLVLLEVCKAIIFVAGGFITGSRVTFWHLSAKKFRGG